MLSTLSPGDGLPTVSITPPWLDAPLPHALPDKLAFGLSLDLQLYDCGDRVADEFRHRLAEAGVVSRWLGGSGVELRVPFSGGGVQGDCSVALDLADYAGRQLVVKSTSQIDVNGMRLLRRSLGGRESGPVGLDGADNVVGITLGREAELLRNLLPILHAAMEAVVAAMERALSGPFDVIRQEFWLRSAEACVDLACDAPWVAAAMRWAPPPGALRTRLDVHLARGLSEPGSPPVAAWRGAAKSAAKVYAKTPSLLRAEVAPPKRPAVSRAMGSGKLAFGGEEAVELVLDFLRWAEPSLQALAAHALAVGDGGADRAELVHALAPLYDLARCPLPARGKPPSRGAQEAARAAYRELLDAGWCRARRAPSGGALRRVLDGLAEAEGPLLRDTRAAIFKLRPRFALAFAS